MTLVGFEVAKLAKIKGFKSRTISYYFEDGELRQNVLAGTNGYYGDEYMVEHDEFLEDWNDKFKTTKDGDRCFGCTTPKYLETYSAPTQSELQKWLRDKHNIVVEPLVFDVGFLEANRFCYQWRVYEGVRDWFTGGSEYTSYEAALEVGLLEALKLIDDVY